MMPNASKQDVKPALSQETEHFCRWRQQKVAKSISYGLPRYQRSPYLTLAAFLFARRVVIVLFKSFRNMSFILVPKEGEELQVNGWNWRPTLQLLLAAGVITREDYEVMGC